MQDRKTMWEILLEVRPDFASNRAKMSRRSREDRRKQCRLDGAVDRRDGDDRRKETERRKRWKRVGDWGAAIDPDSYTRGYHVS